MRTRDFFAGAHRRRENIEPAFARLRRAGSPTSNTERIRRFFHRALDVRRFLSAVRSDRWFYRQEVRLTSCRITSYLRVTITVTLPVPLARLLSALPIMAPLAAALSFTRIA